MFFIAQLSAIRVVGGAMGACGIPVRLFLLLVVLVAHPCQTTVQDDIHLDLIRHQPCIWRQGWSKWSKKLEFEGGDRTTGPQLKEDPNNPSCYFIAGKVTVNEPIHDPLSIFIAISNTANRNKPPEPCQGASQETGCGGFGSCLYCSACETFASTTRSVAKAQLALNGVPLDCNKGLDAGVYNNLSLKFCLPTKREFLESQGITEDAIDAIFSPNGGQSGTVNNLGMFASVYIFDRDVRPLMRSQQKLEQLFRTMKKLPIHEPLDSKTYWSLPFNQLLKEQRLFIACHKLYGNVRIVT